MHPHDQVGQESRPGNGLQTMITVESVGMPLMDVAQTARCQEMTVLSFGVNVLTVSIFTVS